MDFLTYYDVDMFLNGNYRGAALARNAVADYINYNTIKSDVVRIANCAFKGDGMGQPLMALWQR